MYGINTILRRLECAPREIEEIRLVSGESDRLSEIVDTASAAHVPVQFCDGAAIDQIVGTVNHQGCVARTRPFRYVELTAVVAETFPPVLVLDRVQDPHNLGALIRTAAAAGIGCVVIPSDGAAMVTPAVEKVASGAASLIPICTVVNITRTLDWLRQRGYWSIGLVPHSGRTLYSIDWPERVAIVLGGERGLRPLVRDHCDIHATIPMAANSESLNASVAGAIAMYEVQRRKCPSTGN